MRESCAALDDFTRIIRDAGASKNSEWLGWALRTAAGRFPGEYDLIAQWICFAATQGQHDLMRTLHTVLITVPPQNRDFAAAHDALARVGFIDGDMDAAHRHLDRLVEHFPSYDAADAQAWHLRALLDHKMYDQAMIAADAITALHHPDLNAIRFAIFETAHAYDKICDLAQSLGGLAALTDPHSIRRAMSAYEARGKIDHCFTAGSALLQAHPAYVGLAENLRHIAIRLDRLAEITPLLTQSALSVIDRPQGLALMAVLAMDAEDYARARQLIQLIGDKNQEAALHAALMLAVTDPASNLRKARAAYRAYRRLGVQHAGPEMQYAGYLFNAARQKKHLAEALDVVRAVRDLARGNPYFHWLHLSLLIANDLPDLAKQHFDNLPAGLQSAKKMGDIKTYLDHLRGDDAGAVASAMAQLETGSYRALNARTQPAILAPESAIFAGTPPMGRVVVFAVVYNGLDYLDAFFAHYRRLGIHSFVIVDNASDDGTRAFLAAQPDVLLYENAGSFREAAHGVAWINPLFQRHALGRWALFVDIDEHLVFPGMDQGKTLDNLVDYAQSMGAGCFASFMLDMFASKSSFRQGMGGHHYFDAQYLRFASATLPFTAVQGGVRGRITGRQFLITKSPLVHVHKDFMFLENNHLHTYLRPSDVSTALLHYKFVGDAKARFTEAVTRGEHFMGARFYRDMLAKMRGNGISRGLWTRHYQSPAQLVKRGLMDSSEKWAKWK